MFYRDSIEFLEPMTNSLHDSKVTVKLHHDMTGIELSRNVLFLILVCTKNAII